MRLLTLALLLVPALAGCSGTAHYEGLDVRPEASEEFVEFSEAEYDKTEELRLLRRALADASLGDYGTELEGVEPARFLLTIDEKWAVKYGSPRNEQGQPLPTPRIVIWEDVTYRVLVVAA